MGEPEVPPELAQVRCGKIKMHYHPHVKKRATKVSMLTVFMFHDAGTSEIGSPSASSQNMAKHLLACGPHD